MTAHSLLYLLAMLCFLLAAGVPTPRLPIRFEWVGAALLTATLLV